MTEPALTWAVAQTEACREFTVEQRVLDLGFETYLPRCKEDRRVMPLFPGYVFVHIAEQWMAVRWTVGVVRVIMSGDHPARLPDSAVAELKSRERKGFVQLPPPIQAGTKVLITRGPFASYSGLCEGQSSRARVRVLLALLGHVELPIEHLQALA